ncbi:MAG: YdcF family protein [Sphingobium sp.]
MTGGAAPSSDGRPAIIIFGAAVGPDGSPSGVLRRRVEGALACGRTLASPLYFVTGGLGRFPPTEAEVMRRRLVEGGVADTDIVVEDKATDTLESVRLLAPMLRERGIKAVHVCSSAYHNPRCALLLRIAGFRPHIPPMPRDLPTLGKKKWIYYALREVPAALWDAFLSIVKK